MPAARLDRLVERAALEALIADAAALAPDLAIGVIDVDGAVIVASAGFTAGAGFTASAGRQADVGAAEAAASVVDRPIVVDRVAIATVQAGGPDRAWAAAVAGLVARAIELAAGAGLARRDVTAASIVNLRELALLSRLTEVLGSTVDPAGIAGSILATVARPLGATAAVVFGPDDQTPLAVHGPTEAIETLRSAAVPIVARLRAQDARAGACVEVDGPAAEGIGSILAGFLRTARGHHGTIVLGRAPDDAPFGDADRQLLAAVASQAAVAIERAGLQRQLVERRAFDQELAIGRRIQISLMPRRFPVIPGWEIASAYEPAREVGGDFYDVFRMRGEGDCVGLVVADVTGKGIPAAILMADSRGLIHAAADHIDDPSVALARVNTILIDERASGLFVTVALAILDTTTGALVLARAGHDPIHILRADGRLDVLDPPGRLIGMVAELGLVPLDARLEPGDAYIGHTDGVTEARDIAGGFYGEERFRAQLAALAGSSAARIVETVIADVAAFRGEAEPSDDVTLLVVRRQPIAEAPPPAG